MGTVSTYGMVVTFTVGHFGVEMRTLKSWTKVWSFGGKRRAGAGNEVGFRRCYAGGYAGAIASPF